MRTLVLDTNVIQQDPTILARGGGDLRIIVPSAVLSQLEQYRGLDVHPRLTELIRRAHGEHKIEIRNPEVHAGLTYPGLDSVDAAVLNVARELPDSVLVTRDPRLRHAATAAGVRALTFDSARQYLQASPDSKVLSEAKKAIGLKWAFFIVFQLIALLVASGLIWFLASIQEVRDAIGFVPLLLIIAVFAIFLYVFRAWCRFSYGVTETVFGLLAVMYSLKEDILADGVHSLGAVKLGASLYIVIRGLDNAQRGLRGTNVEDRINKLLPP